LSRTLLALSAVGLGWLSGCSAPPTAKPTPRPATSQVPVKTLTTVRSVSQEDPASELMVLVDGGRSVKMSSLQRISG
jgi:hypothetical protein